MTGPAVLLAAVALAAVLGVGWRLREGRFARTAPEEPAGDPRPVLAAAEIGAPLGSEATLVQLSTAFCAPCRAARSVLSAVADARPGVRWVEVDAEAHLDLVRRLDVRRTPTVLLLDRRGRLVTRASGVPRRDEVERLVDAVVAAT